MGKPKSAYWILVLNFFFINCIAHENIFLENYFQPTLIGTHIQYIEDATNLKSVDQIIFDTNFIKGQKKVLNFNLTASTIWIKITLPPQKIKSNYAIDISSPLLNVLNIFRIENNYKTSIEMFGDNYNFRNRKYLYPNYIIDLVPSDSKPVDYYLQMKNHEQFQIPIYLGEKEEIFKKNEYENALNLIFITIILVMFFYNLFIYISVKDKSYLLYVLYIISIGIAQISLKGYGFYFFWANNIWLQQHATYLFSAAVGVTSLMFFKQFIGKGNISKVFIFLINFIISGYVLIAILSIFKAYALSYLLLQLFAMFAVFVVLIACAKAMINKVSSANYFLIAWVVFIIGIFVFVLKDYNIIPYNLFSIYTMPAGSAIEVILLSFALANRIKKLQKDKESSQLLLLQASKENERIVSQQNIMLEKEVKQRTLELETALQDLKRSEVELINKEKMSSLGVLTAGIAHEINNPINFVTSSIAPLKRDIKDILLLLNEYDSLKIDGFNKEQLLSIEKLKKELDTPYLVEEINLLLNGIEEGAVRTAGIVRGLQKFSRSDEHIFRNADVLDGIENTLTLLNSQIKDKIKVVKCYENIPQLYCSIGKLNQVFLNLISNAIYAVLNNNKKEKIITISANVIDDNLQLSIKDNGIGIEESLFSKIFDPFFTTKEVGQGTGLGLAISQGIIHDHKGNIKVKSNINLGSEFVITLPFLQPYS